MRAQTVYDTTSTVVECAIVTGKDILLDRRKNLGYFYAVYFFLTLSWWIFVIFETSVKLTVRMVGSFLEGHWKFLDSC